MYKELEILSNEIKLYCTALSVQYYSTLNNSL